MGQSDHSPRKYFGFSFSEIHVRIPNLVCIKPTPEIQSGTRLWATIRITNETRNKQFNATMLRGIEDRFVCGPGRRFLHLWMKSKALEERPIMVQLSLKSVLEYR